MRLLAIYPAPTIGAQYAFFQSWLQRVLLRYLAVCHPHYFRNISTGGSANCRLLGYIIPVLLFSFLFNLPRFFETEFEYTVSRLFKQCEVLFPRHFPKWQLPRVFFQVATSQMCNFPRGNFPSQSQLQRSALIAACIASEGLT